MKNVLFIDKPQNITSFGVCKVLRKVFGIKRIGHTGTLDPLATGVLIVLLDKATKANQFLVTDYKEYLASAEWGKETDTLDSQGQICKEAPVKLPSKEEMEAILANFRGEISQVPPLTSAIKIRGKKLYEYQRQNIAIAIPERKVNIYSLELIALNEKGFTIKTRVSAGTYIRSLVRDIAKASSNLATLVALRRLSVDTIDVSKCDKLSENIADYHLQDLNAILANKYVTFDILDKVEEVKSGHKLLLNSKEKRVFLKSKDEALAIYELREDGYYHCVRGLF